MSSAVFLMHDGFREAVYPTALQERISAKTTLLPGSLAPKDVESDPGRLKDVDYIFGTWGMPTLDETLLDHCPGLQAVFYAAGSVRGFVTPEFWKRGITLCSAWQANGIPVAEFTVAQIVLGLKRAWPLRQTCRAARKFSHEDRNPVVGAYGTVVGLVSLGMIGRMVAERLHAMDLEVIAYDPFTSSEDASRLGVRLVGLDELFAQSQVVSLHTPWLPETVGMVNAQLLRSMVPSAVLINTARGAIIHEPDLITVLRERPDIHAMLDVTHPEPPPPDSPMWDLENVFLTPHIAGAMGRERIRLGAWMVGEFEAFLEGRPLSHSLTEERARIMA